MAEPQTLAATHPAEVWAALAASVTVIGALVTALWTRQNNDLKAHELKLEAGAKAFAGIGEQFVKIGEQIKALEKEDEYQDGELDRLELDIKALSKQLTIIQTEHDNCPGRK